MRFGAAILTLSDRGAAGERPQDLSGDTIHELIAPLQLDVATYQVLPDDRETITRTLEGLAARPDIHLILTTGGTGLASRDVTPDATLDVIEYQVPGIAEAMRREGLKHTPMAMLSRAVVGVRARTLIVNLPGSPRGVRESLTPLLPVLTHALEKLADDPADCEPDGLVHRTS